MRVVITAGGARTTYESWFHAAGPAGASLRVRAVDARGVRTDDSTDVSSGGPAAVYAFDRARGAIAAEPVPAGDPPEEGGLGVEFYARLIASGAVRRDGTARHRGRALNRFTGPPAMALLGIADPARAARRAQVRVRPPGAVLEILAMPDSGAPVVAERLPATPRSLAIFDPPRRMPGVPVRDAGLGP